MFVVNESELQSSMVFSDSFGSFDEFHSDNHYSEWVKATVEHGFLRFFWEFWWVS